MLKKWEVEYFKALYAVDSNNKVYPISGCFPKLRSSEYVDMNREVTQEKIKAAIFDMKSWKAPKNVGLPAKFFQQSWNIVAESFTSWVKATFHNPTNIAEPQKFIPILIANTQADFIPSRVSADNILVVQKVIHMMRNRNQAKGLMTVKIDLEKAYDKLNWLFVVDLLKDAGITDDIIIVIAFCISTPAMNLL
ncbi:uncharacterized protein [Arachis hypogaea]|uniref:uncharacterized protein n=1 Tax=Arachis hypogaea TaxID=3818 RepID=UPI003B22688B